MEMRFTKGIIIAMENASYVEVLGPITVILYFISVPIAVVTLVLTASAVFCFKNPNRFSQEGEKLVLSPADGMDMSVTEVEKSDFIKGKGLSKY